MRHRIDVSRIVNAALQRDRRFFVRPGWYLFSCHGYQINWITVFARIIQQISLPLMAIALADLLDEKQVILRLRARKPANALREIVRLLAENGKIDQPEKFLEQVIAREQVHPSVVEHGVVFPHSRTDLVDEIILGIGRSRAGIPFGENGVRAHLIFLIGVPQQLVNDYLICVGTLARLVKDDAIRSILLHAETPREFLDALTLETV
jgi:mannitol/fructose-specific phosphotransferase system IIA component (Ntr-type)